MTPSSSGNPITNVFLIIRIVKLGNICGSRVFYLCQTRRVFIITLAPAGIIKFNKFSFLESGKRKFAQCVITLFLALTE